jgi:hypothetical protein
VSTSSNHEPETSEVLSWWKQNEELEKSIVKIRGREVLDDEVRRKRVQQAWAGPTWGLRTGKNRAKTCREATTGIRWFIIDAVRAMAKASISKNWGGL